MQAPHETIIVDKASVGCDGGGGALGHPMVYLTMRQDGTVDCPYCGRHYVQSEESRHAGGHGH